MRLRWLGTEALAWDDLLAVVKHLPPSSATFGALYPDEAHWGLSEHLLALLVDVLQVANWQRGPAKRHEFPKPLKRPGLPVDERKHGTPTPLDEMHEWLGWD